MLPRESENSYIKVACIAGVKWRGRAGKEGDWDNTG